jgi:hypothetical protein
MNNKQKPTNLFEPPRKTREALVQATHDTIDNGEKHAESMARIFPYLSERIWKTHRINTLRKLETLAKLSRLAADKAMMELHPCSRPTPADIECNRQLQSAHPISATQLTII